MSHRQLAVNRSTRRGNNFSLSLGERAGVRAGVSPFCLFMKPRTPPANRRVLSLDVGCSMLDVRCFWVRVGSSNPCIRHDLCYFYVLVRFIPRHLTVNSKAVIASLLAGLVLLLDAMAACPTLHELIHKDASSIQHQCVVTLFAHGQVDSADANVALVAPQDFVANLPPIEISVYRPAIENLPAGRAPPVRSSNS